MAEATLNIVCVDGGSDLADAATHPGPSVESVAAATASKGAPAREREPSGPSVEKVDPLSRERAPQASESSESNSSQPKANHDGTAVDVAARVAQMTARAFGLSGLIAEIQHWQQTFREVGGLFKGAVAPQSPVATSSGPKQEPAGLPAGHKAATPDKDEAPQKKHGENPASDDSPLVAAIKNFVGITAPRAFGDFANSAIDKLGSVVASGPETHADPQVTPITRDVPARDEERSQTIKVDIPKQNLPQSGVTHPVGKTPTTGSGVPLPTFSLPRNRAAIPEPVAPPVIVRPPIGPMVPTTPAVTTAPAAAPLSGVAAWTSASAPARAAAVPAMATGSAIPAVAAPAAAAGTSGATTAVAAGAAGAAATSAPVAGAAAGAAAALGPVGVAAIGVAAAFAALAIGTKKLTGYLSEEAQKLAGYSSATAAASGESEVRREQAMLRRGNQIGPQMAQFERFRGRTEERLIDIGTSIQGILLSLMSRLEPFIDKSLSVAEAGIAGIDVIGAHLSLIEDILTPLDGWDFDRGMEKIAEANKRLGKEIAEIFQGEQEDPLLNDFLTMFENLGPQMADRINGPRRRARPRVGGQ